MNVTPFRWDGCQLLTCDDWQAALMSIFTRTDAAVFMAEIYRWYPGELADADDFVGYMTAEVPRPLGPKLRRLLGVSHPLNREDVLQSQAELMKAGFEFARSCRQGVGAPGWFRLALSYPRLSGATYTDEVINRATEIADLIEE